MTNQAECLSSQNHKPILISAAVFAAVGVFCAGWLVRDVWQWRQMRDWQEVSATIEQVELIENRGRRGAGRRAAEGVTTYRVTARYRYCLGGTDYTGERVGLHGGADNIGSFQREKYELLKRHHDRGEPIRAFVNPSDPTDAVLFREMRWGMLGVKLLLAGIFGGVGMGLTGFYLRSRHKARNVAALKSEFPDEPWRSREDSSGAPVFTTADNQWRLRN